MPQATLMQVSWIDANEVDALLGHLRDPAPAAQAQEPSALGTGWGKESAAAEATAETSLPSARSHPLSHHSDLQSFREKLQALQSHAIQAGFLAPSEDEETATPLVIALPTVKPNPPMPETFPTAPPAAEAATPQREASWGSSVEERFSSFARWVRTRFPDAGLYIVGDQGEMLWGHGTVQQSLVQTTIAAWLALKRMGSTHALETTPVLRQPMADGRHLLAIACPTRLGLLHLALTRALPITDDGVPELRTRLIRSIDLGA